MAQNKNALIRFRTIDKCLQNCYRTWTLEDLIEACSDALYEYEGRDVNVSKRTVQMDIQLMRSDKLGYNAPIVVYDKKYYKYEDSDFSITDIPLNETDMQVLTESVEMLKQFKDFSLFSELGGIIQRLEDKIYTEKTNRPAIIHLDKNEQLRGLEHLDTLYQAILKKLVLKIKYQSFTASESSDLIFHPFILKEYNNRWFLIGKTNKESNVLTLALDRIQSIEYVLESDHIDEDFDGDEYYKNTVGVTVKDEKFVERIVLKVDKSNAPYVLTKPLHHTQKLIKNLETGSVIIELSVHQNFELDRLILGFGETMQVIKPMSLKRRIQDKFQFGLDMYNSNLSKPEAIAQSRKLQKNGYAILNDIFTRQELRQIGRALFNQLDKAGESNVKSNLLESIVSMRDLLMNENVTLMVKTIDPTAVLTRAIFYDNTDIVQHNSWSQSSVYNSQNQAVNEMSLNHSVAGSDDEIPEIESNRSFNIIIHLDSSDIQKGTIKIIPGSHSKVLTDSEIETITSNCVPTMVEVKEGGIQLMHPLILNAATKPLNQKRRRLIVLEFGV